ncbi:pseudouridine synthase [Luteolibacter pohnpeiensis]|uniref:Pseudouridine synthase n=1 Tax=Luteolibacter pohnpeiensis TaxID=454153 RepID=A0A934S6W7_9BACT|nr:pseudouridine synthase [Luteolibacter pohnpeiensis]MBK1883322.1 pseudouridine synthase [Luteolibacter pohnpeiensis]
MVIAFHKPYGVLSQFTQDQPGQRTLAEFGFPASVYPLGRLDLDSEGLILLSDEPGMNNRLLDPSAGHSRTYLVQVDGAVDLEATQRLSKGGLVIKGHRTLPCRAAPCNDPDFPPRDPPVRFRKEIPTSWVEMTLKEGKNRQVRRMTAAVGFPTLRLIRVRIGSFELGALKVGEWREMNPTEISAIWK